MVPPSSMPSEWTVEPVGSREIPYGLLLLADESDESVADYRDRGRCFGVRAGGTIVGEYIVLHTRPFTAEIVSLAVDQRWQRRGIGRALVLHAVAEARRNGFRKLEIGTGEADLPALALYRGCGFVDERVDRDYFVRHYPHPIMCGDRQCRSMQRLGMELR